MTALNRATLAYAAPFAAFVGLMGLEHALGVPPLIAYPIRFVVTSAVLILVSRAVVPLRPSAPVSSIAVGMAVFFI